MVELEIETIDIGLFVRMSSDYVIPIFSDYAIPIFRLQEVTYLQTRYIESYETELIFKVINTAKPDSWIILSYMYT